MIYGSAHNNRDTTLHLNTPLDELSVEGTQSVKTEAEKHGLSNENNL